MGGFPNYFGHQRFGTIRPNTHLVGCFLTKGDVEKAALTFLAQTSLKEHPESREARKQLENSQDFKKALYCFPKQLKYERLMLVHLAKKPRDFLGAFRRVPLKLRKLFIHAYQSFLFNKTLSKRCELGIPLNKAQIGDYVAKLEDYDLPATNFTQVSTLSPKKVEKSSKEKKMRVAIPLIGFKQPLSDGIQREIEQEILETENVNPQDFRVSFMPEVGAPGRLRIILAPAINLLVEESEDLVNPHKRKIILDFSLHRGSYATVLIREFMKPKDPVKAGF
jgi:tRNA pseudouridine13 synthase